MKHLPVSIIILALLPGWILLIVNTSAVCADASRPNVVLIYTDDHAHWAVGGYGNKDVHTPHMDRLAVDGMRFTRGFTKAVCSPSRAMALTGLYSHRFSTTSSPHCWVRMK